MKSKINIKLLFFTASIVSLILTIISVRTTYARYITSLTAKSYVELGEWLILVNDLDVTHNSDVSSVLTPIIPTSDYIAEGNLVPTSSGYVMINLNYESVTVPFTYNISFTNDAESVLKDLRLTSYTIDGGEDILIDSQDIIITDTVYPTDTTRTKAFKLNFAWYDGENEVSDDIQDTAYTHDVDGLGLRFNLEFTQILPETLQEEPQDEPQVVTQDELQNNS